DNTHPYIWPYTLTVTMPDYSINLTENYTYSVVLEDGIIFSDGTTEIRWFAAGEEVHVALPAELPAGVSSTAQNVDPELNPAIVWGSEDPQFVMPAEMVTISQIFQLEEGIGEAIVEDPESDLWDIDTVKATIDGVIVTANPEQEHYYLTSWTVTYIVT